MKKFIIKFDPNFIDGFFTSLIISPLIIVISILFSKNFFTCYFSISITCTICYGAGIYSGRKQIISSIKQFVIEQNKEYNKMKGKWKQNENE